MQPWLPAQAAPEEAQAVPQATAEAGSPELVWEEEAPGQSQAKVFPDWLTKKDDTVRNLITLVTRAAVLEKTD